MGLSSGARIGSFEVVSSIGAGGMGEVYRARDTRLDRDVALKILPEAFGADPDRLSRFEREAKTLASLNHPHIAQIHGIEGAGQSRAIVMELVEGETLAERIARRPHNTAVDIDEELDVARQIAEALEAAHDAGIVHRDLKPANIKVRADGTVKVLDFGLAKAAESETFLGREFSPLTAANSPTFTTPAVTAAGVILGTAAYMSPEQARGRIVDKRSDIWAFGCVLYELLTGRPAFPGETVTDVIAAVVRNEPDWRALPSNTPARIRRLLARCLQKDPRARLRDIGDARIEIADAEAIVPPTDSARTARMPRLALWITLTALIGMAVGLSAGIAWRPSMPATSSGWMGVLVGGPATVMQPVLSPDSQFLAVQTLVDGQTQIAVLKPDTGLWRVLTSDRTRGLAVLHDWSPDGSRIYYDRQTDTLNGVFAVPALGGEERLVLENAGYPVAMANGDLLVQRVNAQRRLQLHRFSPSTGQVDPLPATPDTTLSDDAVVASGDGHHVYFYGQPLDDPDSASAFYVLDLQSGRLEPLARELHLRPPISMAMERSTNNVLVGGIEGDAFQIVRVSPATGRRPETIVSVPAAARFDADARGNLFIGLRSRPAELFSFPLTGTMRSPERIDTLPTINILEPQTLAPLPDGRFLVASRSGDHDRVLVVETGKPATALVDRDEDTRPPATAVGSANAALMMGPRESPDIAIVNTRDGRLMRRFKAPTPNLLTLAASPDGSTLYYTAAGSVWSMPTDGTGKPSQLGAGDSLTLEAESGDLIVKLDEGERIRLVRMKPNGDSIAEIPLHGDLRLIQRPLTPGAVRQGRLVLGMSSADSWFWHAAMIDLKTGEVTRLVDRNPSDIHYVTWRADGVPIGFGYAIDTSLWRFTPRRP